MANTRWYNDAGDFRDFLAVLITAEILEDVSDVQGFCEKPRDWTAEFNEWEEAGNPTEGDDGWDAFVEKITPEEGS
jgi:hypothetical protein